MNTPLNRQYLLPLSLAVLSSVRFTEAPASKIPASAEVGVSKFE